MLPQKVRHTTLIELAVKSDAKMREHTFKIHAKSEQLDDFPKESVDCLIAYSDEYAAISENAIQSFIGFLSQFELKAVFLQNPPLYIVDQLEKLHQPFEIKKHEYRLVDAEMLRTIHRCYPDRIVGQQKVLDELLETLYPLCRPRQTKPMVLLFYGPTGVGKTETAKLLADLLGERLFRRQFSMFHSDDFASYLFGGRHSQNCLSKELLERESNILLFDEFDKPDPVFHSAFYQLFDEGIFEDKNYFVELHRAIIICTSNYASAQEALEKLGRPIFSRFDAVIGFAPLSREAVGEIAGRELALQLGQLSDEERRALDDTLSEALAARIHRCENARQIAQMVRHSISRELLKRLL